MPETITTFDCGCRYHENADPVFCRVAAVCAEANRLHAEWIRLRNSRGPKADVDAAHEAFRNHIPLAEARKLL